MAVGAAAVIVPLGEGESEPQIVVRWKKEYLFGTKMIENRYNACTEHFTLANVGASERWLATSDKIFPPK